MNSYLQVKKLLGPEKAQELLKGWTPMSCKGQVQKIKGWFKNQSIFSEDKKKELSQKKENSPLEGPQTSTSKNMPQKVPNTGKKAQRLTRRERKTPNGTSPTPEL
ncbi:hypothetical protein O181_078146 [Austropuccinia psidii MF-1]|uniref:Uncharacterized protein n=1 Tax=Austropuccinia psidii MF-1 TaxID=1389203 RepID=A0A9Q3FJG2_9BASI|nr:hypothetical protein [Austropuccinia psidii MF-1]